METNDTTNDSGEAKTIDRAQIPAMLGVLADHIEGSPNSREAIATGFRLVAVALAPCEDCGAQPAAEAGEPS